MQINHRLVVNAIRVLSAEAVQKANSGHPGMPMGAASMAQALWGFAMKHNPENPNWPDRDRFVLSSGHGSMLIYSLLHLYGYGLTIEDLQQFRQFGSRTPGHPELGHTRGIETTTGPLGQGIANAVGMAMAEAHLAEKFNRDGYNVVDHNTYVIMGDGCLMEGLSHEACSLAGTLKLNKLIALYDDNEISIEGDTDIAFREDVPARFRAYGWNVIDVADGNCAMEVMAALTLAKSSDKPTLIVCHTQIGYGSPKSGMASAHGEPLGAENVIATKKFLDWPCMEPFGVPQEAYDTTAAINADNARKEASWNELFQAYTKEYPELAAEWALWHDTDSLGFDPLKDDELWSFSGKAATRNACGDLLNKLAQKVPNLFGGSADLAPSNKSYMKGMGDFSADNRAGANLHFGVREHAMAAISNGIQLHGGLRAYCATFFVFSDYMKNAMRMSSIMNLPVAYILSHDSIGVGEDGPTHQPVEQLVGLRAIPGMIVFRPADSCEMAAGWITALTQKHPTALVTTRQDLPLYENSKQNAFMGGYVLADCDGTPDVILMASGSEVEQCMGARDLLANDGVNARVVSMPSFELFEAQSDEYKQSVFPKNVRARVAVEAASSISWGKYVGLDGATICMDTFGASAPYKQLFPHFGFTSENVAKVAKQIIG